MALVDKTAQVEALSARVAELEEQLARANKRIFGRQSERVPPPEAELNKREGTNKKRGGNTNPEKRRENAARKAALDSTVINHPVPKDELRCPHCGEDAVAIGDGDPSMEYEWIPGHLLRRVHVVEAARCPCKLHYVRGPAPVRVQAGCTYGPGFIAKLVVDRCADSLPLYRVERAMDRAGIPIARSTMGDLVHLAGDLCAPLYDVLLAELKTDPHVQADETTIRLQTTTTKAWVWTFLSELYTAYVFSTSRSGDTPKEVLGGTTGSLTVDGYTGYNVVTNVDGRDRTGCWSHARRGLFEAMPNAPHARRGLDIILDLFQVERTARNHGVIGTREHHLLRQRRSVPILEELRLWRLATARLYEPKSTMGRALGYIANQWQPLCAFIGDPKIPIHNNASEAALRIIALIRKNSMFFGNEDAARRFMVLHTLVATCDRHGVNPVEYLTDILLRIQDWPKAKVADLLPHRWKVQFASPVNGSGPGLSADEA